MRQHDIGFQKNPAEGNHPQFRHTIFDNAGDSIGIVSVAAHDQDFVFLVQDATLCKFRHP